MNVQPRPIPRVIYRLDNFTGQVVAYPACGEGVDFLGSDPNVQKRPAPAVIAPIYVMPQPIPQEKIGHGIDFFEGTSAPKPASDKFRRDEAIFG